MSETFEGQCPTKSRFILMVFRGDWSHLDTWQLKHGLGDLPGRQERMRVHIYKVMEREKEDGEKFVMEAKWRR